VLGEIWEKRGGAAINETVSARLEQAKSDAEQWLSSSSSVAAVHLSSPPRPLPVTRPDIRPPTRDGG
ncbi:MAG: hypothetical protein M3Y26_08795, partial [Actinomycetota bacterium]|nr:hypothetical protein [Actinomycetota bacterium]